MKIKTQVRVLAEDLVIGDVISYFSFRKYVGIKPICITLRTEQTSPILKITESSELGLGSARSRIKLELEKSRFLVFDSEFKVTVTREN